MARWSTVTAAMACRFQLVALLLLVVVPLAPADARDVPATATATAKATKSATAVAAAPAGLGDQKTFLGSGLSGGYGGGVGGFAGAGVITSFPWTVPSTPAASSRLLTFSDADGHEEVTDDFSGTTIWWYICLQAAVQGPSHQLLPRRGRAALLQYRVVFHRRHRDLVVGSYLPFVLGEGRAVTVKNRQRRLFTNNASRTWNPYRGNSVWSHVPFEHPATLDTLAMHPGR
ncbi:hypothetical protein ZWY2020_025923 [Hordeum vulgare]|nr:hypothetical protein ZWY2020_025923 [Hordeum vulgare]